MRWKPCGYGVCRSAEACEKISQKINFLLRILQILSYFGKLSSKSYTLASHWINPHARHADHFSRYKPGCPPPFFTKKTKSRRHAVLTRKPFSTRQKMYYTVTRLNASAIQNVIRLSPAIPVTPFHWINNEAELQQMNRTWIRFVDADGWALLGAHQELSLEGTYEYIITLLIQQHYRGLSIVQLHSERPLPDLIVALGNQLTEATSFPCVYYYGLMIHLGSETMGPLRDFIRSLPREIYRL